MKANKILIASLLLLAILTLGAVSAAEDADDLTATDTLDLSQSSDVDTDIIAADGEDTGGENNENTIENVTEELDFNIDPITAYEGFPSEFEVAFDDENVTGNLTVSILDETYLNEPMVNGKTYSIDTSKLAIGEYTLVATYTGDEIHNQTTKNVDFQVKNIFDIPDEISLNDNRIDVYLPSDATGTITVTVGNKTKKYAVDDVIYLPEMATGLQTINATYSGDEKYNESALIKEVNVTYDINLDYFYYNYVGNNVSIVISVPEIADYEKLSAKMDNKTYEIKKVTDEEVGTTYYYVIISGLVNGTYEIFVSYEGDDNLYSQEVSDTFSVEFDVYCPSSVNYHTDKNITFNLPNAEGKLLATIGDKKYDSDFIDGVATIPLYEILPGDYEVKLVYFGNDYEFESTYDLSVNTAIILPEYYIDVAQGNVSIDLPEGTVGDLYVWTEIEGEENATVIHTDNGGLLVDNHKLLLGEYTIYAKFVYENGTSETIYADNLICVNPLDLGYSSEINYDEAPYANITMPEDAAGIFTVSLIDYNGTVVDTANSTFENGVSSIVLSQANPGEYTLELKYSGDDYGDWTADRTLNIGPKFESPNTIMVDEEAYLYFELPNAKGNLSVYLDEFVETIPVESSYNYTFSNLSAGVYTIFARFTDENGTVFLYNWMVGAPLFVKEYTNITVDAETVVEGEDATINITVPGVDGEVTIKILNDTYTKELKDNVTSLIISNLTEGSYNVTVEYEGDSTHINATASATFEVKKQENTTLIIKSSDISLGEDAVIEIESNADGDVALTIGENNYTIAVENGTGNITVSDLAIGTYDVIAKFDGNRFFTAAENSTSFEVTKISVDGIVSGNKGNNPVINITMPSDATGNLTVVINNKTYTQELVNGSASIEITGLSVGTYTAAVAYSGDEKYESISKNVTAKALTNPKITAKALTAQYSSGAKYSVTVYGTDGKVAKSTYVVFKIAGKQVAKVKTNSKGVATFTLTQKQTPGTYKISATALGKTVTKTLKVKRILTLKTATIKKSAKKLVLTATLSKVNKKYLKGKKITFKINGKTYSAKTNKYGVAKVTIKKSVLKKFKVGKKYAYTATYLKDTVKKISKVKR